MSAWPEMASLGVVASGVAALGVALARTSAFRHDRPPDDARAADRLFVRSIAMLGVSSALAVNGVIQLTLLSISALPQVVDVARLVLFAAAGGTLATLALTALARALLGRSHRTFRTYAEIATIGLFGAATTAFVELRRYNIDADTSAPERIETAATSGFGPSGGLLARVRVTLAPTGVEGLPKALHVTSRTASVLKPTDRIRLVRRGGALGVRWIAALESPGQAALAAPREESAAEKEARLGRSFAPAVVDDRSPAQRLGDAIRDGKLRAAGASHVPLWVLRYEERTGQAVPAEFRMWLDRHPVYLVDDAFEVPARIGPAKDGGIVLVRGEGKPLPRLAPGASVVLDLETGACVGSYCRGYLRRP